MSAENSKVDTGAIREVLGEVFNERLAQHQKWGQQDYPILDPDYINRDHRLVAVHYGIPSCFVAQDSVAFKSQIGKLTFLDILIEEVSEVAGSNRHGDKQNLRKELIQVAAVAVQMVESLDRNGR